MKGRLLKAGVQLGKTVGVIGASVAAFVAVMHFGTRLGFVMKASKVARGSLAEAASPVTDAWASLQTKVTALDHADDENARLRVENANLRLKVETLEFSCQAKNADVSTEQNGTRLSHETGTKIGRTIASFNYRVPEQLPPSQLYALGVSYFKAGENEKAAAILSTLATLDDAAQYKDARDLLMTGVAWYRVDNLDLAEQFFDEVLKQPETAASVPYQAKARAWKGLVSERQGKHFKAQYWLRELIDHHPRSVEAAWVNGGMHAANHPELPKETEKHDASSEP